MVKRQEMGNARAARGELGLLVVNVPKRLPDGPDGTVFHRQRHVGISVESAGAEHGNEIDVWRDVPGPILGVSTRWKHLHLPVPEALAVCFPPFEKHLIPCGKKFVRESQPEIDNNFSAARPPIVCEGTNINGATAEYIPKILERAPTFSRTASHRVNRASRRSPALTGVRNPASGMNAGIEMD